MCYVLKQMLRELLNSRSAHPAKVDGEQLLEVPSLNREASSIHRQSIFITLEETENIKLFGVSSKNTKQKINQLIHCCNNTSHSNSNVFYTRRLIRCVLEYR